MASSGSKVTLWTNLLVALGIRLVLLAFGAWQDMYMRVKFTDVDYNVFTDAAQHVVQGESPYRRATYRYTPLLAWLLTFNIYWTPVFGKLLFIVCDIVAGYLIYAILKLRHCKNSTAVLCAQVWLFNPLTMTVSVRGNAESLMAVLVLTSLFCIMKQSYSICLLGFIVYAAAVHVKIYPATYALPLYLFLDEDTTGYIPPKWLPLRGILGKFWPNRKRVLLVTSAVLMFVFLTGVGYMCYGDEFLQETYLYHVTRRDIRHNFSAYFYALYLSAESPTASVLGLAVFLPQLLLLVLISFRYYRDPPMCCFLQTCIFVTFNKVCTSQYFLWYLSLLPLVMPALYLRTWEVIAMVTAWFLSQALWLSSAYYLEFEGKNTFIWIWLAGLGFFTTNILILGRLAKAYIPSPVFKHKQHVAIRDRNFSTLEQMLISLFTNNRIKTKHL